MEFLDFLGGGSVGPVLASDSDDEHDSASPPPPSQVVRQSVTRLLQALRLEALQSFQTTGYLVLDDAFQPECARTLAGEIVALKESHQLHLNATAYVTQHREGEKAQIEMLIRKPGIFETELHDDVRARIQPLAPHLNALYESLPLIEAHFRRHLPHLDIQVAKGLGSVKLQYNEGNRACFPFHFDSPGGLKDTRRITLLLYLNEGWSTGVGGEIVLQPFLASPVHVRPLFNRVVIFKSAEMLHRVMPSHGVRKCLTLWLHGLGGEGDDTIAPDTSNSSIIIKEQATESADFATVWMQRLSMPKWQRALSKIVYGPEWCESYYEAHGRRPPSSDVAGVGQSSSATISTTLPDSMTTVAAAPTESFPYPLPVDERCAGGEPLVASLLRDRVALEGHLNGSGILDLLQQSAGDKKQQILRL